MKQVLWIFALSFLIPFQTAIAQTDCFNFSQDVNDPLHPPITIKAKADATASGDAGERGYWGAARGVVDKPIQKIYAKLLDHYTIKDPAHSKLHVYEQPNPKFQDFHLVMVTVETPMMDVSWEEQWAYKVLNGTKQDPKKVLISYQKTDGTKFVPHLCGSIVLEQLSATKTDVYLYEEINALGKRSSKDTVKGHLGTLATLRKND